MGKKYLPEEEVYDRATYTLAKLSESIHRASSVRYKLIQSFFIWYIIIFTIGSFSLSAVRNLYNRESKSEVYPIDLISIVVTVFSVVQCITLGTATFRITHTLFKASRNYQALSVSLHKSQDGKISYDK